MFDLHSEQSSTVLEYLFGILTALFQLNIQYASCLAVNLGMVFMARLYIVLYDGTPFLQIWSHNYSKCLIPVIIRCEVWSHVWGIL